MHGMYIKINDSLSFLKFSYPRMGVLNQAILHSWWPHFNLEVTVLILKLTGEYVHSITVFKHVGKISCSNSAILSVLIVLMSSYHEC
jgi:hypothetical protein